MVKEYGLDINREPFMRVSTRSEVEVDAEVIQTYILRAEE